MTRRSVQRSGSRLLELVAPLLLPWAAGPASVAQAFGPGLVPPPSVASEAEAVGDWAGALATPVGALRIIVHIRRAAGGYGGTLDSPDQDAVDVALGAIVVERGQLAFTVPAAQAAYRASWDAAKHGWDGQFTQGGLTLPLSLSRVDKAFTPPH